MCPHKLPNSRNGEAQNHLKSIVYWINFDYECFISRSRFWLSLRVCAIKFHFIDLSIRIFIGAILASIHMMQFYILIIARWWIFSPLALTFGTLRAHKCRRDFFRISSFMNQWNTIIRELHTCWISHCVVSFLDIYQPRLISLYKYAWGAFCKKLQKNL